MSDQAATLAESPQTSSQTTGTSTQDSKEVRVGGVKDKEEESDVAKDEKKDSEKPLLDEKDRIDVVAINVEAEEGKTVDTPTLPLPQRKSKTETDEGKEPPSMFLFPLARIKYTWDNSSSLLEFFTRTVCIIFASLGWMVLVGGVPLVSIVQLVIGSIYLHDCPVEPRIPEYLIVAGIFGTILHGVAVVTKYAPKDKKVLFEAQRRRCLCIEAVLQIFLLVWFIAGCFWVYTVYEPVYNIKQHPNYCHKVLYLFTFWMFNIVFIILILIVTMGICCVAFIAMGPRKPSE